VAASMIFHDRKTASD